MPSPRRRPNAWMSSSRCTRPQRQRRELRPKRPRRSVIASSSDFDDHLRPGGQPLEEAVVAELPALDQRRREPADEVSRVLEHRMGQVDAGEDAPRVAAERAQRVLREPRHERLVDGRLHAVRVHDRVPRRRGAGAPTRPTGSRSASRSSRRTTWRAGGQTRSICARAMYGRSTTRSESSSPIRNAR